jgi:hypothetical protein
MKNELIDIACEVRGETDKAYRIFDGIVTAWVPKSVCELSDDRKTLTIEGWVAEEKGFV